MGVGEDEVGTRERNEQEKHSGLAKHHSGQLDRPTGYFTNVCYLISVVATPRILKKSQMT